MSIRETIKMLNDLIQTAENRRNGFAYAARKVTRTELKILFQRHSVNCGSAVMELQKLVRSLGGEPRINSTIVGMIHRGWGIIKINIDDVDVTMLRDVERSETQAKLMYAKALTTQLPQRIRSAVQLQHYGVVRNHSLLHDLLNCQNLTRNKG